MICDVQGIDSCRQLQAEFGGVSAKPTHLAVCHVPGFDAIAAQMKRPVPWHQLHTLGGCDTSRCWRTSTAQEYPPDLNYVFAAAHVQAWAQRYANLDLPRFDHPHDSGFIELFAGDVNFDIQHIGPDSYGPRRSPVDMDLMD
eukprot:s345_g16.t1